jgi:sigma-B regulation protein RsbU (phosphoserine phosphatase)
VGAIRHIEVSLFKRVRLPAPKGLLARLAFWLLLVTIVASLGRILRGLAGELFFALSLLSAAALAIVLTPIVWRATVGRFLWKVRNRLIVTYLLMGLAPVVLFLLLACIASYMFLGQFAIFAGSTELDRSLQQMSTENHGYALTLAHAHWINLDHPDPPGSKRPADPQEAKAARADMPRPKGTNPAAGIEPSEIFAFVDGHPIQHPLASDSPRQAIANVPAWAQDQFHGIALADGHLFERALDSVHIDDHTLTVITSAPLTKAKVDRFAEGLGRITIVPDISLRRGQDKDMESPVSTEAEAEHADAVRPNTVVGGTLPPPAHFYDLPVHFFAPLPTKDWQSGANRDSGLQVTSRPTLLYQRLFITSLDVGVFVRDVLIGNAIFFGLLELAAFLMAMRLNQTITRSVNDLYSATLAIDSGQFTHRIAVTRKDQLAALSQSFNTMTASIERLLEEQREKERLQGELEIAQEVQANLFPSGHVSLPTLEVFGVCQPARTVSGDYYDFLVAGSNGLSLALGDISGKGISAALLMATLHSAVRAYRFMGEDLAASSPAQAAKLATMVTSIGVAEHDGFGDGEGLPLLAASFAEPGEILGLLNRHLYRSTQSAKYATLFLAHYDGRTAELTYSTGGQPPPLLLRTDDSVVRLDCGGTVIGLMDAMRYEQGRETMRSGDILIAYSDGVTEPENDFGDFGEDRLVELVRRHRRLPLEQIADQILVALRSWIGAQEQPDDITLVLARQR